MCTVTFIPKENSNFILTSNRDEHIERLPSTEPIYEKHRDFKLLFPKDQKAGGTWIASSSQGKTVCLLNGAFTRHVPAPPYKKSRGKVVLDYFTFEDAKTFYKQYPFEGIEPFTLVILEKTSQLYVYEFRWDGTKKFFNGINRREPHIWSSVTLYSDATIQERETWFKEFLAGHPGRKPSDLESFHYFGGSGNKDNDIRMKRLDGKQTLSITQVYQKDNILEMKHYNLATNSKSSKKLEIPVPLSKTLY